MESGQELLGRYRLHECLGLGGMSVVWRGYDLVLDRDVAIKILRPASGGPPVSVDAIHTEARIAARLTHPNVAHVFDYGEVTDPSGRAVPFVVMELLRGTSLADLAAEGPVEPELAIRACAQVAAALSAAHAQGLVHRDVKPGNVILTADGAKVFDFGISLPAGSADDSILSGPILGTPQYMAPERIEGGAVSTAADVYALGVLLFRLLTQAYPWPVTTATEFLAAHVYAEPADLPALPGVPGSVRALYRRCLEKRPEERPSAEEAAAVLAAASVTAGAPAGVALAGAGSSAGDDEDTVRGFSMGGVLATPASRWLTAAAAVMVAAVLVAAASLLAVSDPVSTSLAQAGPEGGGPGASARPGGPVRLPVGASPGVQVGTGTGPGATVDPLDPSATPSPGATTTTTGSSPAGTTQPPPNVPSWYSFESAGGSVVAGCYGTQAYLLSWTPAEGYRSMSVVQGPAPEVGVSFRLRNETVELRLTCAAGDPMPRLVIS